MVASFFGERLFCALSGGTAFNIGDSLSLDRLRRNTFRLRPSHDCVAGPDRRAKALLLVHESPQDFL